MLFGTATHQVLEAFFRQAQQPGTSGFGTADELTELFQRYFARSRFELPAAMFQRLATAGPQLLRAWWAQAALTAHGRGGIRGAGYPTRRYAADG